MNHQTPQARFAAFVRQAITTTAFRNSTTATAALSGAISRSTLYRWMAGDWHDPPELNKVRAFCKVTDADLDEALALLRGQPVIPAARPAPPPARTTPPPAPATTTGRRPVLTGRCPLPVACSYCASGRKMAPRQLAVEDTGGIALMTKYARRALPPLFHRPDWDNLRREWVCRVCPSQPWPCSVAQAHGDAVGISYS